MSSINDVAEHAGVSRQTVSNVLNNPERVRDETRQRVLAAIDELDYHPNRRAQNLRSRRSHLLGIDVAEMGSHEVSPVIDRFIHALSVEASHHGYHVLLFPRTGDATQSHVPLHETHTVDGFVLVDTEPDDARAAVLVQAQVPFVAFGRTGGRLRHDVVDVDGAAGGRAIAEELAASGCERPAFVAWPEGSLAGEERLAGFKDGWRAAGHDPEHLQVVRRLNRVSDGVDAAQTLVDRSPAPDAIVAVSDLLAVGVVRGLRSRSLRPGRDLRVIGYDDAPIAAHLDPPLTTVRQPLQAVAARIIARFLARLDDPDAPVAEELLAPQLVIRET